MISRDLWIQIIAGVLVLLCMGSMALLSTDIAGEAGRAQLAYTDQANDGDPPEVALGVAMGAFRGLFVNYLWIRANRLKEEGKFYEAIELSSTITRLQPRFPRVWSFHAWNMAYNISVATNTASERWQWVNAGINLLRHEGIPRNPNDVHLHRELAWIFVHKIQGYADDANHYYKRQVAREWTYVLGEPPRLDGSSQQNRETMAQWLQPIVEAPATLDEVARIEIAARLAKQLPIENGPDGQPLSLVKELAQRIERDAKIPLDSTLLRFVETRKAWINAWYIADQGFKNELRDTERNVVVDECMQNTRYEDAWPRLLSFVRRRVLIDQYNMEPERMQRYTRKYGPMDWRHACAHSIYWASRGVEEGLERQNVSQFDTLNTDRIVMHSIQELYRYGAISFDLLTDEYFALTNFDWIDPYGEVLTEMVARGGVANDPDRVYTLYSAGYENFLKDVVRVYYNRGDLANAEKYHQKLRTFAGLNINDSQLVERLTLPLAEFVEEELKDRITTPHVALGEFESALSDAYLRGLGEGKPDVFKRQMEYAQKVRQAYLSLQGTRTLADPETLRMKEYLGETFADGAARVLLRFLAGGSFGEYNLGPNQAALLYRRTPVQLQRVIYDALSSLVQGRAQSITPEVFAQMFPAPPGMEEYRAQIAKAESQSDRARRRQVEFEKDPNRKDQ